MEGGEEEVRDTKVFDIRKIYWDKDGNLRHGRSKRNRDDEILTLLQKDHTDAEDKAALWIIIPNRWLRTWLIFAYMKMGEEPGKIDTKMLLTHDPLYFNNWRPLRTLKPPNAEKLLDQTAKETPGHYRYLFLRRHIVINN